MKWFLTILLASFAFTLQAQEYKLEGNEVKIAKPVLFERGSARLKPESMAALGIIKQYLTDKSYISQLRVECHTDNSGDATINQALTEKRAMVVCRKLMEMGVDCKRLIAVGFGDTKPVADNSTAAGRAQNLRVSFINVSLRGKIIGGLPIDGGGKITGELCN
ncbi:MAG: OmpA family protein [Ferruginibacter sp.]|nr:OmpA family protein [Chitinophagaceae bacterium]